MALLDNEEMRINTAYYRLVQSEGRKKILLSMNQPMTATHIARRSDITLDSCLRFLRDLMSASVIYCLNEGTRHNRLYWLTAFGIRCQRRLRETLALRPIDHRVPDVPWDLYSSVCYSHRSSVIGAMNRPMQAVNIKRKALFQNPRLRMSANNTRDVLRYLSQQQIVRKLKIKRRRHPTYALTDLGATFKELLLGARGF